LVLPHDKDEIILGAPAMKGFYMMFNSQEHAINVTPYAGSNNFDLMYDSAKG
jgi:hypothetical protein